MRREERRKGERDGNEARDHPLKVVPVRENAMVRSRILVHPDQRPPRSLCSPRSAGAVLALWAAEKLLVRGDSAQ